MSERAYHFWKGCEFIYGDVAIHYDATPVVKLIDMRWKTLKILAGAEQYFELPEMYTTSLFHRSLLDDVRTKQYGKVFTAHPQDANLGAISSSLEKKYLYSGIPLGWVGTSPKSAGMAVSAASRTESLDHQQTSDINSLQVEYTEKIKKSALPYHKFAGDFMFGSMILYFWQALLQTEELRSDRINKLLAGKITRIIILGCVMREMRNKKASHPSARILFLDIIRVNNCSLKQIRIAHWLVELIFAALWVPSLLIRGWRKTAKIVSNNYFIKRISLNKEKNVDLVLESARIATAIQSRKWIQLLSL